jgi:hypothetical protein
MKVPVVYTWEIYGDLDAPVEECYRAFNPTTKESRDAVVEAWFGAPITLVSMLDQHPDISFKRQSVVSAVPSSSSFAVGDEKRRFPWTISFAFAFFTLVALRRIRRSKRGGGGAAIGTSL